MMFLAGHTCVCPEGYDGEDSDGFAAGTGCPNVNECSEEDNPCFPPDVSVCIDTEGSFLCLCKTGFIKDARENCVVPYSEYFLFAKTKSFTKRAGQ